MQVVVTNQMTTKFDSRGEGHLTPALGTSWGHWYFKLFNVVFLIFLFKFCSFRLCELVRHLDLCLDGIHPIRLDGLP